MRVAIDSATLRRHRACSAAYDSPEFNEEEDALVYSDFSQSVNRLMATELGRGQLKWLVRHGLVPMTIEQFEAAVVARGAGS